LAVFKAPFAGTVTGATFMPSGNITGHDTARRDLDLYKGTAAGSLSANGATLDFMAGVDASAQEEIAFNLNATLSTRQLNAGDYLHFKSDAVGAGVADPGGLIVVEFTRDPDAD
jgi:hypothetical protein